MNIVELKQNEISVIFGGTNTTIANSGTLSHTAWQHVSQIGCSCLAEAGIVFVSTALPLFTSKDKGFQDKSIGGKALMLATATWGAFRVAHAAIIWGSALAANALWSIVGY
jgi:hypothetical protein